MIRITAFFFSLILSYSCSETLTETSSEYIELNSAEYLSSYVKNPVIFQVSKIIPGSDQVSGYLFTKMGEIRAFQINSKDFDDQSDSVNISYLEKILAHSSAMIRSVDLDKYVQLYKYNLLSGRTEVTYHGDKANENYSIIYSSYILKTEYTTWKEEETHCPVHHDPFAQTDEYLSVVLKSEGRMMKNNYGGYVASIVEFLKSELASIPEAMNQGF